MTHSRPLRVALTGGAGSGKSAVASLFRERGIAVVDTDQIAREVVQPGTEGLNAVVETFGESVLNAEGGLDRRRMRQRVLSDTEARQALESILHPRIMGALSSWLDAAAGPYAVAEIPLLAESGGADGFDRVISVEAPMADRLSRLQARDGVSESEARSLISAQATEEDRRAVADDVIENDADLASLKRQVDELDARLRAQAEERRD